MQTDSVEKAAGIGAIGIENNKPAKPSTQSAYGPHCMDGLAGLLFSMPSV